VDDWAALRRIRSSFHEFAAALAEDGCILNLDDISLIDKDVRVVSDEARVRPERSEVQQLVADTTKADSLLGWKAEVDLDDGLRRTIDWIRDNLERYKTVVYNV